MDDKDAKVPQLLNLTRKLLDQAIDIVKIPVSHTSVERKGILYQIFLRVQLSEALKFGYGAYYSCYHGWGHGGIGAARSIYEILLDIRYINQDDSRKEERFTRFADHGAEYLYREMQIMHLLGEKVSQEDQDERTNTYEWLKKKYKDKHDQDIKSGVPKADVTPRYRPYNWAGIDLSQKVKDVKMDNVEKFHQFYKYLSNLSHGGIDKTLEAITGVTENQYKINLNLHYGFDHCYLVLIVVFPCIFWILEEYMEYFGIERSYYPNLEKIEEDCKKLLK